MAADEQLATEQDISMSDLIPDVQLTFDQEARIEALHADVVLYPFSAARLIVHLQDRVKELEEKLEELHDAHDTLEAKHDKCGAVPEVTGAQLVTDFDRGYAEGYSDAGASTPPGAVPVEVLRKHWLTGVECDHANKTDVSTCYCGRWRSDPQPNIPAAVNEWIKHLLGHCTPETTPVVRCICGEGSYASTDQCPVHAGATEGGQ